MTDSLRREVQAAAREAKPGIDKLKAAKRALQAAERKARKMAPKTATPNRLRAKSAEGQREPRIKEPAYLGWIRRLPCIECVRLNVQPKVSQAAHIRAGYAEAGWRPTGMQEKPSDRRTAPLCQEHHLDGPGAQHRAGERAWWAERGIYPPTLCSALGAAFDDGTDGAVVVRMFAAGAQTKRKSHAR